MTNFQKELMKGSDLYSVVYTMGIREENESFREVSEFVEEESFTETMKAFETMLTSHGYTDKEVDLTLHNIAGADVPQDKEVNNTTVVITAEYGSGRVVRTTKKLEDMYYDFGKVLYEFFLALEYQPGTISSFREDWFKELREEHFKELGITPIDEKDIEEEINHDEIPNEDSGELGEEHIKKEIEEDIIENCGWNKIVDPSKIDFLDLFNAVAKVMNTLPRR